MSDLPLAQAVGTYRERPPIIALRSHFSCTWMHEMPTGAGNTQSFVVVPDGAIDLLWIDGRITIAGPDRKAVVENIPSGTTVLGFRFRPGAAARWLRTPVSEHVNCRVPLEDLWGAKARRLVDATRSGRAAIECLENHLARLSASAAPPDLEMGRVHELLKARGGGNEPVIPQLSNELAMSERTLRRRCHEAFGYGAKTLDRILRFQRFLKFARRSDGRAALLALEAGYADQAHLAREVRALAGRSPSRIVEVLAG